MKEIHLYKSEINRKASKFFGSEFLECLAINMDKLNRLSDFVKIYIHITSTPEKIFSIHAISAKSIIEVYNSTGVGAGEKVIGHIPLKYFNNETKIEEKVGVDNSVLKSGLEQGIII